VLQATQHLHAVVHSKAVTLVDPWGSRANEVQLTYVTSSGAPGAPALSAAAAAAPAAVEMRRTHRVHWLKRPGGYSPGNTAPMIRFA
jgi:hypothetical protein